MKAIIMADGKQKRYEELGYRKQFISIDGQPIIERTIDLLQKAGLEVWISTRFEEFNYLKELKGVNFVVPENNEHEVTKFWGSHKAWENDEKVLFIYGDTYFTESTMSKIVNINTDDYLFFMSDWEIFAVKFDKACYNMLRYTTEYIANLNDEGRGGLCGAWTLYRALQQKDLFIHQKYDNYYYSSDETFDFDSAGEVEKWCEKYSHVWDNRVEY